MVALGLMAGAGATAGEVLVMRADILINLIAARARLLARSASAARAGGGSNADGDRAVTIAPDGTRRVAIRSMESLTAFLQGGLR